MTEQRTHLFPFYQGWDAYQGLLINALAPLSDKELALRAAPHLRSIGENAAHIVGTRTSWFHMLMGEGDATMAPGTPGTSLAHPPEARLNLLAG